MTPLLLAQSPDADRVGRLLDALGVLFDRRPLAGILADGRGPNNRRTALILSEDQFALAYALVDSQPARLQERLSRYSHILVYPFRATADGLRALSAYTAGRAEAASIATGAQYVVNNAFTAAGPFGGLTVTPLDTHADSRLWIRNSPHPVDYAVSLDGGGVLMKAVIKGTSSSTELFVAGTSSVLDPAEQVTTNLTAAERFSGLVPLLFFLRHSDAAFWRTPQSFANVIIDDLNLRPRYGFVNAAALAQYVDQLRCAVSIAFIPWNCRRTSRAVVDLFRSRWPRLSLSIHGCDHIGAEFAVPSVAAAQSRIALSLARMNALSAETRLPYDRIMVFPQGRFSDAAMAALRQSDLDAAVNTELVDYLTNGGVPAAEVLKPAITAYAGFPLFLRRRAHEPLTDFALDLLLGKPCLVVTHHDDFREGMDQLVSISTRLSSLAPSLQWTNLGTIATATHSVRRTADGTLDIRLLASRTTLPPYEGVISARFSKHEPLPGKELEAAAGGEELKPERDAGNVTFTASIAAAHPTTVECRISPTEQPPLPAFPLGYRAKVGARRYLSEIRDNHIARSAAATAAVRFIRGAR
jgi:hypothetical protein